MRTLHAQKMIAQKITPFLGVSLMFFGSLFRYQYAFFSDYAALFCIVCCYFLTLKFSCDRNSNNIHHAVTKSHESLFFSILIGFLQSFFVLYSLFLFDPEWLKESIVFVKGHIGLSVIFITTWAFLLQKAEKNSGDPIICYAYWPRSALWRLPALLSYYGSSNGLFVLITCCICYYFFEYVAPLDCFFELDLIFILFYIFLLLGLIFFIVKREFIPSRPFVGIGIIFILWIVHGTTIYYGNEIVFFSWTFGQYKKIVYSLSSEAQLQGNLQGLLNLPFSLCLLWGVFWGSAFSILKKIGLSEISGLLLGHYVGFHWGGGWLDKAFHLFSLFLFLVVLYNALRSQSPIQSIDCPWRQSKRLPLKPSRWLLSMSMAPWTFSFIFMLTGKPAIFFVLHNFSLLIVLGLAHALTYEIVFLVPSYKTILMTYGVMMQSQRLAYFSKRIIDK